ncbi:putative membrane protein [Candidatus Nanobsidianus stetteri]|uniref:Putative membrane protein n=1 Tax=Nanobsidianus stetteri TaxID=1294122 RepID=R1G935_NANST|nr:putative membrane protein [Candidatus Nanobsidianus stetteri]
MGIDILYILIVIFDILISIWNAYNAGKALEYMKLNNIESDWPRMVAYSTLILSFAGAAYGNASLLSIVAYYLGYIDIYTLLGVLSFSFLVFGFLIILFGIVITVNSIIVASKTKSFFDIFIAIYNSIAVIWDIYTYIEGFSTAFNILKDQFGNEDRNSQGIFVLIIIAAVLIAVFMVYGAFKYGKASVYKVEGLSIQPSPIEG